MKTKLHPPRKAWIEWSEDCAEILATHGTMNEAITNKVEGSVIAGPYTLAKRLRKRKGVAR